MESSNLTAPNSNHVMFSREFALYLFINYTIPHVYATRMHMHRRYLKEFKSSHQITSRGLKWENKPYKLQVKRSIDFN